jgi:ATP-dependent Lon protease
MDNQNGLSEIQKLVTELQSAQLPATLREKAQHQIERIILALRYGGNLSQLDITEKYIDWITHLPWFAESQDTLDINEAKKVLDKNHYGLERIKQRVLEYLSILIVQKKRLPNEHFHAPSLFFVGLAGTGKTTFAMSIAEALNRKFIRIPFGGLSSALDLRGQSKTSPEAEPSIIIREIRKAGVKNPVILLDELDRITPEARAAIMGVLIELLDPGQNRAFTDYFLDYPFDLSEVLFVATANNTNAISTAVMDRLEVIQMPSYTDNEKIAIAKSYVFPHYLKEAGLTENDVKIEDAVWPKLTRPLGFDAGIRTLERTIEGLVRKVAYKMVSGKGTTFVITEANVIDFVPAL